MSAPDLQPSFPIPPIVQPDPLFYHIIRDGRLMQSMFVTLRNASRSAKRQFPDGNYRIIAAPGRAALREMGIIVDRQAPA